MISSAIVALVPKDLMNLMGPSSLSTGNLPCSGTQTLTNPPKVTLR